MRAVYSILLAILAAILSVAAFEPLRELAIEVGVPSSRAFAFPVVVSGTAILIIVSAALLRDRK